MSLAWPPKSYAALFLCFILGCATAPTIEQLPPDDGGISVDPPDAATADLTPITGCIISTQTGCPIGYKCTSHDALTTICDPDGTVMRAGICTRNKTTGAENCVAGQACTDEGGIGQCRSFCNDNTQCGTRSYCEILLQTNGFKVCTNPCTALYPGAGCAAGLGCYAYDFEHTDCKKAGTAAAGAPCAVPQDCQPGMTCLGPAGATRCRRICTKGFNGDCPVGQSCLAITYVNGMQWPTYGACF